MKIIIAPDTFRGCLEADKVANLIAEGIKNGLQKIEHFIEKVPISDGGELFTKLLIQHLGGKLHRTQVTNPIGKKITAEYGILSDKRTAIVEMASASGINLLTEDLLDPLHATTYGTGELIKNAIEKGCKKIVVGLGGSATIDGGAGMAQALGVRLLNKQGKDIDYGPIGLEDLNSIDISNVNQKIKNVEVLVACDVSNILIGPKGAAAVFGPQKGATEEMISLIDRNLRHYSKCIKNDLNKEVCDIPYGGASGGLGAAFYAFFDGKLKLGIDVFAKLINFQQYLTDCDLLITAEGKVDLQTVESMKGPFRVAQFAKKTGIPVILIVGQVGEDFHISESMIFDCIFSICNRPMTLKYAIRNVKPLLKSISEQIGNLIRINS